MASKASICSMGIPRRLREHVSLEPAVNCAAAMQDLTETMVAVDVIVDREVDVKVVKSEFRLRLTNKLERSWAAPKNFACGLPGARPSASTRSESVVKLLTKEYASS